MTTQNKEAHPFWSGFVVGSLVGTGLMYLVGTKKGRETAQKILENTENFEGSVQSILNFLRETDILPLDDIKTDGNSINTIIDKMTDFVSDKNSKK